MDELARLRRLRLGVAALGLSRPTLIHLQSESIRSIADLLDRDISFFPTEIADEVRAALERAGYVEPSEPEPPHDKEKKKVETGDAVRDLVAMIDRSYREDFLYDRDKLDSFPKEFATQAAERLRDGLDLEKGGKHARRLYAIIRLEGADAPELAQALRMKAKQRRVALEALVNRRVKRFGTPEDYHRPYFSQLPEALLPLLLPLAKKKSSVQHLALHALCLIPSSESVPVFMEVLDRLSVVGVLRMAAENGGCPAFDALDALPDEAREHFRKAAAELVSLGPTSPHPKSLSVASAIAVMARADEEIARLTLGFFHHLPHPPTPKPAVTPHNTYSVQLWHIRRRRMIGPFVRLLLASIDLLDVDDHRRLAPLLLDDVAERFPPAAAAWARLPDDERRTLADDVRARASDDREMDAERWAAMVDALDGPTSLDDFFTDMARNGPPHLRGIMIRGIGSASTDLAVELVKRAFDVGELTAALEVAVEVGVSVIRPTLVRLREGKFRLEGRLAELVELLITDDDEDWVEQEIDGENPFRDRREALRAMMEARKAPRKRH